jgi:uncharacterized Zn finger protein (UPF0148 family)
MGWKNVKEHYRIGHIVHVTEKGICIGSGYISEIIVIDKAGTIIKRYDSTVNEGLLRYQQEMDADPETLKRLIKETDTFSKSIAVYTYEGGEIIEKQCEEPGWPNVTHDGCLMYENLFSTDKMTVVQWAIENAKAAVKLKIDSILRLEKQISEEQKLLSEFKADLEKLESEYQKSKYSNY